MDDPKLISYIVMRLEKIDEKVDLLLAFKWQLVGITTAVAFLTTIAFQVLQIVFQTPH